MNYELPGRVVVKFDERHFIVEEHSGGGNRFSFWGPDISGRTCRMGRYSSLASALASGRAITQLDGRSV